MLTLHRDQRPIAFGHKGSLYTSEVSGTGSCVAKLYHTVFRVTGGYVC